jgi:uncharacterized delta-60 repeat protein
MKGEKKSILVALFIIYFSLGIVHSVNAYPGELDTTFHATYGFVTYNSRANSYDFGNAVAIQPDGKILVGGILYSGSSHDALLLRYHSDGTIDSGFGTGGAFFYDGGVSGLDSIYAIAIQPDGKILAAGIIEYGSYDVLVIRLNSNGTLDPGFGAGGIVTYGTLSNTDEAKAVVLQPDGKIIVAGYFDNGSNDDVLLLRYTSSGLPDTGFGTGGVAVFGSAEGLSEEAKVVLLQPDGRIVVAGSRYNGIDQDIILLRFNNNGTLDAGFGSGGIVVYDTGFDDITNSAALQVDGKIVVAGEHRNSAANPIILRFNANGSLDTGFGGSGVIHYSKDYDANAVALQTDGKIIVAGEISNPDPAGFDVLLFRLLSNGSLDSGFGTGGIFTFGTSSSTYDYGNAIAIQTDGNIVVVGETVNADDSDVLVLRVKAGELYGPDLTVGWTSLSQQCSRTGCRVKGKLSIKNVGTSPASSSAVRFFVSDDPIYDTGDILLKKVSSGTIKAGSIKNMTFSCPVPAIASSAIGKYLIAVVDADNVVPETDETNNTGVYGPMKKTNLSGAWTALTAGCSGSRCRLSGTLQILNSGDQDAPSSRTRVYLSDDGSYDISDTLLKQFSSGIIKGKNSRNKNINCTIPAGMTATGKYVIALLDADNTVTEELETDNTVVFGPMP